MKLTSEERYCLLEVLIDLKNKRDDRLEITDTETRDILVLLVNQRIAVVQKVLDTVEII